MNKRQRKKRLQKLMLSFQRPGTLAPYQYTETPFLGGARETLMAMCEELREDGR